MRSMRALLAGAARRRRGLTRTDEGAYAVLFALLVVVLVGMAALALDLALVRESRAMTRSAADSAVIAAAAHLNDVALADSRPRDACLTAWGHLRSAFADLDDGTASCSSLPVTPPASCPTTPMVADWSGGRWQIRITWPVLDSSTLMTDPDTAPAYPTQALNTRVDGANPCSRIAVEVFRTNQLAFAGVLGVADSTTRAASVARSLVTGQISSVYAALNILDQTACDALTTNGQAGVTVGTVLRPGVIAVESSATAPGNSSPGCSNSNAAAIKPSTNVNNFIQAVGTGASIQSFAMNPAPLGNPPKSFFQFPGPNSNITPTPVVLPERIGALPVTAVYSCTAGCQPGGGNYIGGIESRYATGVPAGFTVLPDPAYPDFVCNQNTASPAVVLPAGNWYVNCSTLDVQTTVIFRGGTVVTRGSISLGSANSCLSFNSPVTGTSCPTYDATSDPVTTTPAPVDDALLYLQSGHLTKVGGASLYLPQVMTYIANTGQGYVDLGGGTGTLVMTSPLGVGCPASDLPCRYAKFYKLSLWSTSTQTHSVGGQAILGMRGVMFIPNAHTVFDGQGGSVQTSSQFWTDTLDVKGQGTLVMDVDPDASISRPALGAGLIR